MQTRTALDAGIDGNALGTTAGFVVAVAASVVLVGPTGRVTEAVPTLVAGTVSGWIFGPLAARATTPRRWAGVVVGLAFVTMLIGAVMTGVMMMSLGTYHPGPGEAVTSILILSLFGILFVGPVAFPLLLIPATAWAVLMRLTRGW